MGDSKAGLGERLERGLVRRAGWVLLGALVVALVGLGQIADLRSGRPKLLLDPSVDGMLPKVDEDRDFYERFKQRFDSAEVILLALVADDVFTHENLSRIQRISEEIEGLEQVDRVTSLSLSLNIRSENGALVTEPFYDEVPDTEAGLADLRRRALGDPIYAGNLVSRDGRVSVVLVHLLDLPERELLASGIDDRIRDLAGAHWTEGEFWIGGGVHVKAEMSRLMLRDTMVVVPFAALVMALVAFVAFRSVRGVLVPMLTVGIATLVTLAFVSLAYGALNQVTAAIPSVMIVVGFAYAMHIVSAYDDVLREGGGKRESAAYLALREVATPVVFTGLTTAAGFGSLATSPITAIEQYGVATALGIVISMLATLTVAPALLEFLPDSTPKWSPATARRIDEALERLARFDIAHRRSILLTGAVVASISIIGLSQVVVGSDLVSSLQDDNPVRRDFERINAHLEGANSFDIVLGTSVPEGFKFPQNLETLEALQRWLAEQPEVGGSTSFVDYIKTLHQGIQDGEPAYYSVPESRALVSQLLVVGGNDELDAYVDSEYRNTRIVVRTSAMDSNEVLDLVARVEGQLGALPQHIEARLTGNTVLISRTMEDIAWGQAKSLATAFGIIYLILVLLFTSFRTGFIALIPNVLPVLVYFGILGWVGIQLNASTGLVATIVLGIAVDDTIHLLANFNRAAKRHADESRGVIEALRRVGKPVTYSTAALCLGFACLTFSKMQPQVEFGLLAAVTLLAAWLVDVTFTPALAARMQIVTIWDVLTLDLGSDPQRSIPLFAGLSATQARVTALLARIEEFPEGHQVMKNGARGDAMYVVIDGELKASVDGEAGEVHLRNHGRGDVIGEVGLFLGARTADVHARSDVRLLRITQQDFENIQRRHPRIGAQLYANLNKVLADRMAELTARTTRSGARAT